MTALSYLMDLAQHCEWADAAVWHAVLGSTEGSRDPRITTGLHHIHTVQHVFRQAWSGEPLQVREMAEFQDPHLLAAWGRDAHAQIQSFLAAADVEQVERELALPWAARIEERLGRSAHRLTVGESALQVILHTAHHRGQVCTRLREVGGEPPRVDFIVWVWAARPEADWSFFGSGPAAP